MCRGVALHVNNAKLDVGMREEALGNRQQSAEVIMNDDHDATKATFNESSLNELPIFKIFTAWSRHTGEDLLFAVTAQANDNVDARRMREPARTDLCGGRRAIGGPTATKCATATLFDVEMLRARVNVRYSVGFSSKNFEDSPYGDHETDHDG